MARIKQTAWKQPTSGKPLATYPHQKPSSKKRPIRPSQDKSVPVAGWPGRMQDSEVRQQMPQHKDFIRDQWDQLPAVIRGGTEDKL